MTIDAATKPLATTVATKTRPRITVFHCFNALNGIAVASNGDGEVQTVKLPCSSMTREIHLLRAFEAGADAVIVLVCARGACRYIEGNLRAEKRVARVKRLLDEIGLDGRRLNIFNVPQGDQRAVEGIILVTLAELAHLEPSPVAR